ncbi:exodeoxyribonuclease V subunit beta [Bowmanella denitrificans]|uniref:RecBCD enzyme subunit RecB n=1 Tax=Bowmanella denitrificans TaxID=366582 RepID=A0ABN0X4X9_9ALTE
MRPLHIPSFPLTGQSLIEASAGTGKTFTIVRLYLRLLLGLGCEPLSVDKILVVTFTNAATAELKSRLRTMLTKAHHDVLVGQTDEAVLQDLICSEEQRELACRRLQLALRQMDEAAVFTIHGFCQRVLTRHAFESGSRYQQELILDESSHLHQAIKDFWRARILRLPAPLLELSLKLWSEPMALLRQVRGLLNQDFACQDKAAPLEKLLQQYQWLLADSKSWWLENQVFERLWQANLNKRTRLGKGELLTQMEAFCQSAELFLPQGSSFEDFLPEKVAKALSKASPDLSDLDFARFEQLQRLHTQLVEGLKVTLYMEAIDSLRSKLAISKDSANQLSPDDLLSQLANALNGAQADALISAVRQAYPAAMIDEFQDTDAVQYGIFNRLYPPTSHDCLIMIGDPKQAIYAFRGADIFTYIGAKREVGESRCFTLETNWRSEPVMVEAINKLFMQSPQGFLYNQDIPFLPVKAGQSNKQLLLDGKGVAGLAFEYLNCASPQGFSAVQGPLAEHFAGQIAAWLAWGQQGRALLCHGQAQSPVKPKDCAVLVRDRFEAQLMRDALAKLNIASVFLVRKSVFATQIAADLLLLLQAMQNPGDEAKVKAAMLTELVGLSALEFETWLADDSRWQELLGQFFHWQRLWQRQGIASALAQMQQQLSLMASVQRRFADHLRRITDLRHLFELLQQHSLEVQGESQLVHWFAQCLSEPDDNHEGQQLRLETDDNLVQIVTMHAAKGLEYPLVFMPFACRYQKRVDPLYHDDERKLWVDFLGRQENLARAATEKLAEDIRLLYVALTRAEHWCNVGVFDTTAGGQSRSRAISGTALGALLLGPGAEVQEGTLQTALQHLADSQHIHYKPITEQDIQPGQMPVAELQPLECARLGRSLRQTWRLTSYSAISLQQDHLPGPGQDEGVTAVVSVNPPGLDRFAFTRGARAGSFLHGVLEILMSAETIAQGEMSRELLARCIEEQAPLFAIESQWFDVLQEWLWDVVNAPILADQPLRLLDIRQAKVELEFHLPLHQVQAHKFNRILNQYMPFMQARYDFDSLNGMLKGFVDLIFVHRGKLYVADYKSNYLGADFGDYQHTNMAQAMAEHDYYLQAVLYSLALHRWLQSRLQHYDYDQHVGGTCYWFLRGISSSHPGRGIFQLRPDKAMIEALDALFSGESTSGGQMEQLSLC